MDIILQHNGIKVKKALDLLSNTLFIFVNCLGFTSYKALFYFIKHSPFISSGIGKPRRVNIVGAISAFIQQRAGSQT